MIVVMAPGASDEQLNDVVRRVEELGYATHVLYGVERRVVACLGDERGKPQLLSLSVLAGVDSVMPVLAPYKLASRTYHTEPSVIPVAGGLGIGGNTIAVIAGPCAVENEEQIILTAHAVKKAGATALRGGAFKPRSSTYSFQGLGEQGLKMLRKAKQETGLPIVTEVLDAHDLDLVAEYADVLQIGARNMQNYALLRAVGKIRKPILLKRGMMATVEELLMSAEYILAEGNPNVILCERGIRTFERATRNTLDLNAVPALSERSHLPIVVDPSHGTGVAKYVAPMSCAAIACGAAGLMIEVHPEPCKALSDGEQSLDFVAFAEMMEILSVLASALGKRLGTRGK